MSWLTTKSIAVAFNFKNQGEDHDLSQIYQITKVKDTPEAWEDGTLGRDEQFVAVAGDEHEAALNAALDMQAISIRLPKDMIKQYKLIADFHSVGYQPLMRDVLARFVKGALREILEEQVKAENAKPPQKPLVPLKMAA